MIHSVSLLSQAPLATWLDSVGVMNRYAKVHYTIGKNKNITSYILFVIQICEIVI